MSRGTDVDERVQLHAAEADPPPRPARRRRPVRRVAVAAAAVLALGVVAAVVSGDDGDDGDGASATSEAVVRTTIAPAPPGPDVRPAPDGDAFEAAGRAEVASGGATAADSASAASGPTDSAMVVKTGSMSLEVAEGTYDRTVDVITTKAAGLGGYVADSASSRDDGRASGQLTVRVPADRFDGFLSDLRGLGEVVAEDSQGTDVGGQHADLAARLSALRATRDKLGTILAQARTVDETLAVQDRITGIQTQVEQLEGQLRVLEDQVAMSSITLDIAEPGADGISSTHRGERDLGGAWADARRRFGDGIETLVSWSGSLAVALVVGLLLLGLGRVAWPRLRRLLL